jgi:hypothetical protein
MRHGTLAGLQVDRLSPLSLRASSIGHGSVARPLVNPGRATACKRTLGDTVASPRGAAVVAEPTPDASSSETQLDLIAEFA